jgi:hypothetical protein
MVYLIQHYGIKFVDHLWQVSGFLRFAPSIGAILHFQTYEMSAIFKMAAKTWYVGR